MSLRNYAIRAGYSLIEIIKKLFGIKSPLITDAQHSAMEVYVLKYEDVTGINNTRTAANKIAYITAFDSNIAIEGDSDMAEYLRGLIEPYSCSGLVGILSRVNGAGGVLLKPCTVNGEMYIDVLYQNRLIEYDYRRKTAVILVDIQNIKDVNYYLLEEHELYQDGNYTITIKAAEADTGREVSLSVYPAWAEATPQQTYTGVTDMLFSVIKCPTNAGGDYNSPYGVPMTYGQEYLDKSILKLIETLNREFRLKSPRLAVDDRAFMRDERGRPIIADEQLAELLISQSHDMDNAFNIFSPGYQEQSIINAVDYLYSQYENGMGTSAGIFTQIETSNATATEIKSRLYETLMFIDSNRVNLLKGFKQLAYACSVIASANGVVKYGDYTVVPYFDYSLFESSTEKFNNIVTGISVGAWGAEQLRMYELGETLEEAEENLPDITEVE